jgi:hypothetical protein
VPVLRAFFFSTLIRSSDADPPVEGAHSDRPKPQACETASGFLLARTNSANNTDLSPVKQLHNKKTPGNGVAEA